VGGRSFNFSEIVGNGAAAGISNFYYPSQERSWTKTGQRWVTQVGLDGFSNFCKEIWPDVNSRLFHNKYRVKGDESLPHPLRTPSFFGSEPTSVATTRTNCMAVELY
jgi:hypothetical protein